MAKLLRAVALALLFAACGAGDHYRARGVVQEIVEEYDQVVIDHEDIPGLMPAMTMNFDVAPGLLEELEPGQAIDFTVVFDGKSYRVTEFSVREQGVATGDGPRVANAAGERTRAPFFDLIDQDGEPVALTQLRGQILLIDFIFTHCPGPCPILTSTHVRVQRALPDALRARAHFVSISLDPDRDTPDALRAYAEARGADLGGWSFLTGPPDEVDAVLQSYGVGARRQPDGNVDHLVVTFLVDAEGIIVRRYVGLEHEAEEILKDLRDLAS